MVLDTNTLTFVLALTTFFAVGFAPVINARQARFEREEARRREEDQRKEVRRQEELAHLMNTLKSLIQLSGEWQKWNQASGSIERPRVTGEILGTMFSVPDAYMHQYAQEFEKMSLNEEGFSNVLKAVQRLGDMISQVMQRN